MLQASQNALFRLGLSGDVWTIRELRMICDLLVVGATEGAAKMLEKEGFEDFDPNDQEQVMKFMNELTRDDMKKINKTIFAALSELTQGRPSFDQMMELSQKAYRLGQAYMGSLMGDIMDPKSAQNATKS